MDNSEDKEDCEKRLPAMRVDQELQRLISGPSGNDEVPDGWYPIRFIARCNGDAEDLLARARDALKAIISHRSELANGDPAWRQLLPRWLVARFDNNDAGPVGPESARGWRLDALLFWFQPDSREWFWWDGFVQDRDTIAVDVLSIDLPFAWDAMVELFHLAGAWSMVLEGDPDEV